MNRSPTASPKIDTDYLLSSTQTQASFNTQNLLNSGKAASSWVSIPLPCQALQFYSFSQLPPKGPFTWDCRILALTLFDADWPWRAGSHCYPRHVGKTTCQRVGNKFPKNLGAFHFSKISRGSLMLACWNATKVKDMLHLAPPTTKRESPCLLCSLISLNKCIPHWGVLHCSFLCDLKTDWSPEEKKALN